MLPSSQTLLKVLHLPDTFRTHLCLSVFLSLLSHPLLSILHTQHSLHIHGSRDTLSTLRMINPVTVNLLTLNTLHTTSRASDSLLILSNLITVT